MRWCLLLAALAAASAAAPNITTTTSSPPIATLRFQFLGAAANATPAFRRTAKDALVASVDWLSMEDIVQVGAPPNVTEPCRFDRRGAAKPAARPPAPPRALLGPQPDGPCVKTTLTYAISPPAAPTEAQFAQILDAAGDGSLKREMGRLGAPLNQVKIEGKREMVVGCSGGRRRRRGPTTLLLSSVVDADVAGFAKPGTGLAMPSAATGKNTARFVLRLIGRDARFANQDILRVLLVDGVAAQFTSGDSDYVSVVNARIVGVDKVSDGNTGRGSGGGGGNGGRRGARRLLRAGDAPSPPAAAPSSTVAVRQPGLAFDFDALNADPAIDVTTEISRLPPAGVRAVYRDVVAMSETDQFTKVRGEEGREGWWCGERPSATWRPTTSPALDLARLLHRLCARLPRAKLVYSQREAFRWGRQP